MSTSSPKSFHPLSFSTLGFASHAAFRLHGPLFGMGHSIKSSATIQQMEGCTLFLVAQTAGLSPEREATNASLQAIPVLLSHPLLHLSALILGKLSSLSLNRAVHCFASSRLSPPYLFYLFSRASTACFEIDPAVGRPHVWLALQIPSLPSQGICINVPRTWAPHRRRIREVGSLPLDLVTVSDFVFRLRWKRAPLMETWRLVPRKITSR
jgi:hypothetical protein